MPRNVVAQPEPEPVSTPQRWTYSVPELAALLGYSETSLYADARDGWIDLGNNELVQVIRRGRRVVVPAHLVDAALARIARAA